MKILICFWDNNVAETFQELGELLLKHYSDWDKDKFSKESILTLVNELSYPIYLLEQYVGNVSDEKEIAEATDTPSASVSLKVKEKDILLDEDATKFLESCNYDNNQECILIDTEQGARGKVLVY